MATRRPATSKARGLCRYYNQPRGCFAGHKCKFLHGQSDPLTPYDKSKTCIYFAKGYCKRGDSCWFRHVRPSSYEGVSFDDTCCICLEKPITYGLLEGCSHVFCIQCIRQWRDPAGKSGDVVCSGNNKKCPLCRAESRFVTPSSQFYAQDSDCRARASETYTESMARVPCRYFLRSARFCPFGKDCFYKHCGTDGTPHNPTHGVEQGMRMKKRHQRDQHLPSDELAHPSPPPSTNSLEDLSNTISILRRSLPRLAPALGMPVSPVTENSDEGLDMGRPSPDEAVDSFGDGELAQIERLEMLAQRMLNTLAAIQMPTMPDGAGGIGEDTSPQAEERFEELRGDAHEMASLLDGHERRGRELNTDEGEGRDGDGEGLTHLEAIPVLVPSAVSRVQPGMDDSGPGHESLVHVGYGEPAVTSRLFTDVAEREMESLIIDLGSEDEEEGQETNISEDGQVDGQNVTEDVFKDDEEVASTIEFTDNLEAGDEGQGEDVAIDTGPLLTDEVGLNSSQFAVDPEPPFVTDGRGRVVWSSTRPGPVLGRQVQGRKPNQFKTGSLVSENESDAEREDGGEEREKEGWFVRAARQIYL